jgi:hypothetical protein
METRPANGQDAGRLLGAAVEYGSVVGYDSTVVLFTSIWH